jgi:hypothetical protein
MTDVYALVITTVISVAGAVVSAFYANRLRHGAQVEEADRLAVRFREPVLQAAFNLQSRIYNIVRQGFLDDFLAADQATEDEREYAVRNTSYLIGQYLGWVEIIRRESQYVDPRSRERNREIVQRLEEVRDLFAESRGLKDPTMRIFRGEQRAIGEVMMVPTDAAVPGLPRWECLGYARFVEQHDVESVQRWFRRIENDVIVLGKDPGAHSERLVKVQHGLLDLIAVLDPGADRVPLRHRARL